jgi:hypothetical protein
MSPAQPRFVRVTHADAVASQDAQQASEQDQSAAAERIHNERARQETFAVVDPIAPAEQRWRAGIRVDERGSVRQAFSCNCGKHSHGHGEPDHPDGFASIIEPTRFEAEPPEWAKGFNARAENDLRERAAALAARVRASRLRPGKTDRSRR